MDRFSILKNPDLKPRHAYALTPQEQEELEKENRYKQEQSRRTPQPQSQRAQQDVDRESIISRHLSTAQGRQTLAASMINPLRQRMDMGSLARRIFQVDPLPAGALPIYFRENNNPAYFVNELGQGIDSITSGERIIVPLFEIGSNPQIPLSSVRQRRYDLINRAQDRAYQDIRNTEESLAFQLLGVSSTNSNRDVTVMGFDSELARESLRDAFVNIEAHELRVVNAFLDAATYSSIRLHMREHLDLSSPDLIQRTGIFANLWGAQLHVTRGVPAGTIYLTSEPQHVGRLPIQTDLAVLPADNPEMATIGWNIFQNIGMGCFNPNGITRIRLSTANSPEIVRNLSPIRRIGFEDILEDFIPGREAISENEILYSWVEGARQRAEQEGRL